MSILDLLVSLVKKIFGKLTAKQKKVAYISADIINAIKALDGTEASPLEIVLAVIPENLKEKFTKNVVSMLYNAGLIKTQSLTPDESVLEAAAFITRIKGSLNHKVSLNSLGIFITSVLADGKIGWDDLVHVPKLVFSHPEEIQVQRDVDTDGDGIPDNEDDDADGDGIPYLTDPDDPRHGEPSNP